MNIVSVNLKDYGTLEVEKGSTYFEVSKTLGVSKDIIAFKVDNEIISLSEKIMKAEHLECVSKYSLDGKNIYKSGLKFVFIVAVNNLFNDIKVVFEHSVPIGMLIKLKSKREITKKDVDLIYDEMNRLVKLDKPIRKLIIKKKEAINFYNDQKDFEKANNISNINDQVVSLFELNNNLNYFYSEMPFSTSVVSEFNLEFICNNKLVLILPNENGDVPVYSDHTSIIDSFAQNNKWLDSVKMPYISNLNAAISGGRIKSFMESNEIVFDMNIQRAVSTITSNDNIKFIMIAGPSSSGKTTTTKRMSSYLKAMGYDPILISTDDYFLDKDKAEELGVKDYECIESIDLEYLAKDLHKLLNRELVVLPEYDFILGKKTIGKKNVLFKDNSIVLIEGLHSLNEKLIPTISRENKFNVYLSPFTSLNIDQHNYVSSIDLRLIRRIVRDNQFRGAKLLDTFKAWDTVRSGEKKYIFPYIPEADCIINTALEFEIGVLKVYIEPLLLSVGVSSPYYAEAQRLLKFLKQFFPIPGEYVNGNSIIREFIGGLHD